MSWLKEAVRTIKILAASKEIEIITAFEDDSLCEGDAALLRQMYVNLLDNAVKYTPPGGAVQVWLKREGEQYVVRVKDDGVGISNEHRKLVFNRFFRVNSAYQRANLTSLQTSGAGLGLSIALSIAETPSGNTVSQ